VRRDRIVDAVALFPLDGAEVTRALGSTRERLASVAEGIGRLMRAFPRQRCAIRLWSRKPGVLR
jgi:hypothetical protein